MVGIHTTLTPHHHENSYRIIHTIIDAIIKCAVPIFLAISAYFMAQKELDSRSKIYSFYRKYIPPIYIPCLIWCIPICICSYIDSGGELRHLRALFLCRWYYFGLLIIQFYLLLPLLKRLNSFIWVIAAWAITTICNIIIYRFSLYDYIFSLGPFPAWMLYYMLGVWLSKQNLNYSPTTPIIIAITILTLAYINESLNLDFGLWEYVRHMCILPTAIIFIIFSKKTELCYRTTTASRPIERIGKMSFGIYLIHFYIIWFILDYINFESWIPKWTVTLLLSIIFIQFVKLITPRKIATNLLGFRG